MNIADFLHQQGDKRGFSFEVLPPLKGNGTAALFRTTDALSEFGPRFINITTHHSEYVYKELENGLLTRQRVRRRPGTVAIAGAIQNKYDIPVIPHIICSGATKEDIEYELLDLQFLGISNWRSSSSYSMSSFVARTARPPVPGHQQHSRSARRQGERRPAVYTNRERSCPCHRPPEAGESV